MAKRNGQESIYWLFALTPQRIHGKFTWLRFYQVLYVFEHHNFAPDTFIRKAKRFGPKDEWDYSHEVTPDWA